MPSKPIEIPPEIARAFVRDMHAFAAGHNTIKADGIAWAAAVPAQAALSGQAQAHRRERGIWALFLVGSSWSSGLPLEHPRGSGALGTTASSGHCLVGL